jgi:hypothetical protein
MPRRQERLFVADIIDAIEAIDAYTAGLTREQFLGDRLRLDAVIKNLTAIGEAAGRVPAFVVDASPQIPWPRMRVKAGNLHTSAHRVPCRALGAFLRCEVHREALGAGDENGTAGLAGAPRAGIRCRRYPQCASSTIACWCHDRGRAFGCTFRLRQQTGSACAKARRRVPRARTE